MHEPFCSNDSCKYNAIVVPEFVKALVCREKKFKIVGHSKEFLKGENNGFWLCDECKKKERTKG